MAQIINTNIASLNAQRNLNSSQGANSQALERLSSGLRINSAKDDAAGLAISTRFESQTRGLGQAVRNAGDGISLSQTAEGSLGSITDNLQRIRELSVQSANGTNSEDDRIALQAEVSQLVAEIKRTSEETEFNGRALFDGSFDGIFQIGANAGQTVGVEIGRLTTDRLGASDQVGVSAFGTDEALANGDLTINGVGIDASRAGDDAFSVDNAAASAIAKVEAINRHSDETGVTAYVNENVVSGSEMEAGPAANGFITLNGVEIDISTAENDTSGTRAAVSAAINAVSEQTGVRAIDSDSDVGGVQLVAADGQNITIQFDGLTAEETGLTEAGTYEGGYTLVADAGVNEIVISGGNGTGRGDLSNAGLTAGTYSRAVATAVSETQSQSFEAGLLDADGDFVNSVNGGGAAVAIGEDYTWTVRSGGESYSQNLDAAGGPNEEDGIATIANDINQNSNIDGLVAWEQVDGVLDTSNGAVDDTLTIDGVAFTLRDDGTGDVDVKDLAAQISEHDFGLNLQVSAEQTGEDEISLSIRNFDAAAIGIESDTAGGDLDLDTGDGPISLVADTTVSGTVAVASTTGQDVDMTLTSDDAATEDLLAAGNATSSAEFEGPNVLQSGDMLINGVSIGAARTSADTASATKASDGGQIFSSTKGLSAIAVAESINRVSDETGVTASVNATEVIGGDGEAFDRTDTDLEVGDQAAIFINGVEVGTVTLQADGNDNIDADRARSDALALINSNSGKTGVTAVDNGVSLTLSAADGRNISIAIDNQSGVEESMGAAFGLDSAEEGIGEAAFGNIDDPDSGISAEGVTYQTTYGTLQLESAGTFEIEAGDRGTAALDALGLKIGNFGGGEDGQFLDEIDVSTFEGAQSAITAVDNALETVSAVRADLGAIQNRFESTIGNLEINRENLTASNSRIRDADFAAESAELSRTQVLQQAGISILAQANQRPQQALTLLG